MPRLKRELGKKNGSNIKKMNLFKKHMQNAPKHKPSALRFIKLAWILLILLGLTYYTLENFDSLRRVLAELSLKQLFLSVSLIFLGKFLCIFLVIDTLNLQNLKVKFNKAAYWYSYSDMGKYIPGGIWSIVGRVTFYKPLLGVRASTSALITETAFLICIPLAIVTTAYAQLNRLPEIHYWALLALTLLLLVATAALTIYTAKKSVKITDLWRMYFLQSICWLALFPASFFIVCQIEINYSSVIIAFNSGFSAGQLAIFAPSGIGVRELVAVALIDNYDAGLFLAALITHRLLWVLADIVMFFCITILLKIEASTLGTNK